MATFFYSDPHFGHGNIIKYCNRPFKNADEMNEELIKRYNYYVSKNDLVFWLGDCGFYNDKKQATALMSRLNGKKILIRGNHDKKPGWMQDIGFEAVLENATILVGKNRIRLSHYPYKIPWWIRFKHKLKGIDYRNHKKRLKDEGLILIHGHVHNSWPQSTKKMINVSCDVWDYRPVPMKEVVKMINRLKNT